MPQMAPIGWLSLFIIFSLTFILFNMMNYYSILPSSPKTFKLDSFKSNSLNWKW
uniref:ATP synthase complex subunit 8 n=1 Tax=Spaniocelyphus pilosus TaxID=1979293 RepID=A0A1W5YKE5_9MUSC|nr:ATP synthase F0 subunit 8 [Spaniocelyphus pilosus]ARI44228.1 ATP synthase F0 subunit 8 [Spaniocelyphus pilosus]